MVKKGQTKRVWTPEQKAKLYKGIWKILFPLGFWEGI